jgi:hypothetical protein
MQQRCDPPVGDCSSCWPALGRLGQRHTARRWLRRALPMSPRSNGTTGPGRVVRWARGICSRAIWHVGRRADSDGHVGGGCGGGGAGSGSGQDQDCDWHWHWHWHQVVVTQSTDVKRGANTGSLQRLTRHYTALHGTTRHVGTLRGTPRTSNQVQVQVHGCHGDGHGDGEVLVLAYSNSYLPSTCPTIVGRRMRSEGGPLRRVEKHTLRYSTALLSLPPALDP